MSDRHRLILLLPYEHCKPSWAGFGLFLGVELVENKVIISSKMVVKASFLEDALPTRETP